MPPNEAARAEGVEAAQPNRSWTFLSNHGHVLVAIKDAPDARLRELAARVGISERAVQLIVGDLERAGYLVKERSGRRNRYTVTSGRSLRHPAERASSVDDLLSIFVSDSRAAAVVHTRDPSASAVHSRS